MSSTSTDAKLSDRPRVLPLLSKTDAQGADTTIFDDKKRNLLAQRGGENRLSPPPGTLKLPALGRSHSNSSMSGIENSSAESDNGLSNRSKTFSTPLRMVSNQELASLVSKHGDPIHSALLDSSFNVVQIGDIKGIVGFKEQKGFAVTIGSPLCEPQDKEKLAKAYASFCEDRDLVPIYCATDRNFAEVVAKNGGRFVKFGQERILDPTAGKPGETKQIRRELKKAQEAGVSVKEEKVTETFKEECDSVVKAWSAGKKSQLHANEVGLFPPSELATRYFAARNKSGDLIGVTSLSHFEAQNRPCITYNIKSPDAPPGTSESTIWGLRQQMRDEGVSSVSWGVSNAESIGDAEGFGHRTIAIANAFYQGAKPFIANYGPFQKKFGEIKDKESRYAAFSGEFSIEAAKALQKVMTGLE